MNRAASRDSDPEETVSLKTLTAAALCLVTCAPALAQPKAAAGCGKPFTARAVEDNQPFDIACQGPVARLSGPQGLMFMDLRPRGKIVTVLESTREYHEITPDQDDEDLILAPCRDYRKAVKETPGLTCRKTGTALVNGRNTEKWETRGPDFETVVEYFDTELNIAIKMTKGDRTHWELRDVKVGAVNGPMSPPAGYRKLTDEQYAERITSASKSGAKK